MTVLLTPTRKLRDELLHRVQAFCPPEALLPLGHSESFEDLLWQHGIHLLEASSPALVARIEDLEKSLEIDRGSSAWMLRLAHHHRSIFELYHMSAKNLFNHCKVAVATFSWWMKFQAQEVRLKQLKSQIGVVFLDEADANTVGGLLAATFGGREAVLAYDRGQKVWPMGERAMYWEKESDNDNNIIEVTTFIEARDMPEINLLETRRFGPVICELLQKCIPEVYRGLRVAEGAPQTAAFTWYIRSADWQDASPKAGPVTVMLVVYTQKLPAKM